MKKRTVFTSKSLPRVKDKGKALRRVDPDKVVKALGAERIPAVVSAGSPVERSSARMANLTRQESVPSQPKRTITIELDDEEIELLKACIEWRREFENREITIEEAIHFTLKEGGARCNSEGRAARSEIELELDGKLKEFYRNQRKRA
jgi:hypothetical protein